MKKTHCKRGHPRTPDNVNAHRACIACLRWHDEQRGGTEPRLAGKRKAAVKWRLEHPERHRANHHAGAAAKRVRLAGGQGRFTRDEWATLKAQYGHRCVGCGKTETELKALGRKLASDHIIPVSQGGSGDITNIQPLCDGKGGCNNKKGRNYLDHITT